MTMRLLLALLMILSAPLAAAQHLGCTQPAAVEAISDSHGHHAMASADHHDHQPAAAASEPAENCDNCDLACLAACASVAMPASLADIPGTENHTTPDLSFAANLLLSHPLPLLRPPTLSAA